MSPDGVVPPQGRMRTACAPGPLAMVIFGATGDLSRRKLLPALYRLSCDDLLPEGFALVGVGRHALSDADYRARMREAVREQVGEPDAWDRFEPRLSYFATEFGDPDGFERLADRLDSLDAQGGTGGNRLFYLAIPPDLIGTVAQQLARAGLVAEPGGATWSRLVVEKPFGTDLGSARALNRLLLNAFDESQLYRIDHYLGKETVQNLLVFRFANLVWEPIWNRRYVDHVQISVAESSGVGTRGGYYEEAGALRDMVQSHLLQLLSLVAMEPPASYDADSIRNEKHKVLTAVRPVSVERDRFDVVRGQYTAGTVDGGRVPGYLEEKGVPPGSGTETFVALRLWIDNWRWAGVPFFLRTGKRLPTRASEVVVRFHPAPHPILDAVEGGRPEPNLLILRIQPDEGISLRFEAKVPGLRGPLRQVGMHFDYETAFGTRAPEAYERLLLDAMLGDATLFARRDEVEQAWSVVDPVVRACCPPHGPPAEPYRAGSWGPATAERLLAGADAGPPRHWEEMGAA